MVDRVGLLGFCLWGFFNSRKITMEFFMTHQNYNVSCNLRLMYKKYSLNYIRNLSSQTYQKFKWILLSQHVFNLFVCLLVLLISQTWISGCSTLFSVKENVYDMKENQLLRNLKVKQICQYSFWSSFVHVIENVGILLWHFKIKVLPL